jgi:uncharacterized protein YjbI with pentapeptide repeats
MAYFGANNRILVEDKFKSGTIANSQICECDLNGTAIENLVWNATTVSNLPWNDGVLRSMELRNSIFFRSSFMRTRFEELSFFDMDIDCLNLIKTTWKKCTLRCSIVRNCCMQRMCMTNVQLINTSLTDFEALNSLFENCIFYRCTIGITYGSGMNGFSTGRLVNCLFVECRFDGLPFTGALVESSAFIGCAGAAGNDMGCSNVAGMGLKGHPGRTDFNPLPEAHALIKRFAS